MKPTHRVKRTFPASGPLSAGQLVDATNWRNRVLLEKQGYIVPLAVEEVPTETEVLPEQTVAFVPTEQAAPEAEIEVLELPEETIIENQETPAFVQELKNAVAPVEEVPAKAQAGKAKTSAAKKSSKAKK